MYFLDKSMNVDKLKEYENLCLVADSTQVRLVLIEQMMSGKLSLEDAQNELELIIKEAHAKGLFLRRDFFKKRFPDEEKMKVLRQTVSSYKEI